MAAAKRLRFPDPLHRCGTDSLRIPPAFAISGLYASTFRMIIIAPCMDESTDSAGRDQWTDFG